MPGVGNLLPIYLYIIRCSLVSEKHLSIVHPFLHFFHGKTFREYRKIYGFSAFRVKKWYKTLQM